MYSMFHRHCIYVCRDRQHNLGVILLSVSCFVFVPLYDHCQAKSNAYACMGMCEIKSLALIEPGTHFDYAQFSDPLSFKETVLLFGLSAICICSYGFPLETHSEH